MPETRQVYWRRNTQTGDIEKRFSAEEAWTVWHEGDPGSYPPPGVIAAGQPASTDRYKIAAILTLVAGGLIAIGSFLPWITVGSESRSGLEGGGDGIFTLGAAIALIVIGALRLQKLEQSPVGIAVLILGVGSGVLSIIDYAKSHVEQFVPGLFGGFGHYEHVPTSVGVGVLAIIFGALCAGAAGVMYLLRS